MTAKPANLSRETLCIVRPYLFVTLLATLFGIGNGLGVTTLLATVNETVTGSTTPDVRLAWKFVGLCTLIIGCALLSNFSTGYVGQHVLARIRKDIATKILLAPIEQLERFGAHKLIPILVQDTSVLSTFVLAVAPLVVALTVTVGGIAYLALLSLPLTLIILGALIIGIAAQWLAFKWGIPSVDAARIAQDDLQKHYESISEGAKELRIHRPRRQHVLTAGIHSAINRICSGNIRASKFFITAESFGSALFFIVIGLAIAVQSHWHGVDKTVLGGFVLVMLYLKGPLGQLTDALPLISNAHVSMRRIIDLSNRFSTPEPHLLESAHHDTSLSMTTLELRDVCYEFPVTSDGRQFKLGPVNMTIERGDIIFIVGDNGSGKTTLIKLLLGLYTPHRGRILLDGKPVTAADRDDYRQLFTTIFSDYYLFDDLPQSAEKLDESVQKYLQRLDLAHKVSILDGAFSTIDLSTGQRKRLALLNAWLENRPVLLFDEWAADQDPGFRRFFYTELLPELKQLGKTILVISHDDRYFDIADHLIRMDGGQVLMEPAMA